MGAARAPGHAESRLPGLVAEHIRPGGPCGVNAVLKIGAWSRAWPRALRSLLP